MATNLHRRWTSRLLALVSATPLILGLGVVSSSAEDKNSALAAGIQDNLCLIEEAYNQEAGVVQHINCLEHQEQDWFYNFTQEWPFRGQANQLSYTLPYSWLRSPDPNAQGLGDLLLNYRRQVLYESDHIPAFAPRLSLILPTGDEDAGLGSGSLGYQVMLPASKIIGNRVTLHANAELTSYFDVDGQQPTSYLLGGAFIYAVMRDFNLIVESIAEWDQSVGDTGRIEDETSYTVSPGPICLQSLGRAIGAGRGRANSICR